MELIFATGNKDKLAEVQRIFEHTQFKIISLYDFGDVPEIEHKETVELLSRQLKMGWE